MSLCAGDSKATGALVTSKNCASKNDNNTIIINSANCFTVDNFALDVDLCPMPNDFDNFHQDVELPYLIGNATNITNTAISCGEASQPPVLCTRCKSLTKRDTYIKFTRDECYFVLFKPVYHIVHSCNLLFWSSGRTRRKLLLLFGFTTGKYYG